MSKNKKNSQICVGDVVQNFLNVGSGRSWRPKNSVTGVVLEKQEAPVKIGEKEIMVTNITILLSDGEVHTYDEASFKTISKVQNLQ